MRAWKAPGFDAGLTGSDDALVAACPQRGMAGREIWVGRLFRVRRATLRRARCVQRGPVRAGSRTMMGEGAMRPAGEIGMTFDEVRRIALGWPGVEDGTSYGTPALKVKGKLLARLKEDGDSLVVKGVGPDERAWLMETEPDVYYITDHSAAGRSSSCACRGATRRRWPRCYCANGRQSRRSGCWPLMTRPLDVERPRADCGACGRTARRRLRGYR